jgi:diguanylate cyclase (GGDEF)-like protein
MLHPGSSAAGDWDAMHGAVAERLHAILEATLHAARQPRPSALAARTHALAEECAAALTQLRAAMDAERLNQRSLLQELSEARKAVARLRMDFRDSQAGEFHARHLALHDELTDLPNRRLCRERLDEALALAASRQATAALLFLDLDGFKAINDHHGHETGDVVLRIVAARLTRAVRSGDIVCRLGGDEFVCLPFGVMDEQQLAHLATKLIDAVSAPLMVNHLKLAIRPSIGVAIYPTHAANTKALLKAADAAMYQAKQQQLGFSFARSHPGGCAA